MASEQVEIAKSAAEMGVIGGAMDSGVASGTSASDSACHKMVADAWERPPQVDPSKSVSDESTKTMEALEKMGAGNPNEEETLKQMKSIFRLPEDATTSDINQKLDNLSRTMVKEAIGLCPNSSDADVMKQLQELTIDSNIKAVGKENVEESFGLPRGASREQVRDAAGKHLIGKVGLNSKYSRIDEQSVPEMSKLYYDSVARQIKDRFELKF